MDYAHICTHQMAVKAAAAAAAASAPRIETQKSLMHFWPFPMFFASANLVSGARWINIYNQHVQLLSKKSGNEFADHELLLLLLECN